MEEDDIKFQSLPPLKRLRLLQQRHLHDNKENRNPSFRLPSKKRKESRHHLLPDCTFFPLPAKKRVSALHPDFFLDLNMEYKCDKDVESECLPSVVSSLRSEIPQLGKCGKDVESESPISIVPNPFVEIPQLEDKCVKSECPISIVPNPFVEIPLSRSKSFQSNPKLGRNLLSQPSTYSVLLDGFESESEPEPEPPISIAPNPFVEIPQLVKEDNGFEPEPEPEPPISIIPNLFVETPQIAEGKEIPVEEEDVEDEDGIACAICQSTDGDPKDPIVLCDGCDLMVHTTCYGNPLIKGVPDGDWFCAQCLVSKPDKAFSCCLCPTKGGAMKPTKDGLWAHIVCSVYVPEVFFEDPDGREGINCCKIPKRRWQDKCYICKTRKGCAIRCSEPMCPLAFHVTCGLNQDLCIEYKQGKEIIVAGFCRTHSDLWIKQQETGKFKIVASKEHTI